MLKRGPCACGSGVLQIPFGINALGAAHTIPGIANAQMHLDAHALAGIYQCNITQWDHPAIAALNPGLRCAFGHVSSL